MRNLRVSHRDLAGIGMTSKRTRHRLIERLREKGIRDSRVLQTISEIPRHLFIDEALAHRAYEDTALPIGFQQSISQPFIVARMTELLLKALPADAQFEKGLEIGTGSGYQSAVIAPFVKRLHSVERIKVLRNKAAQRLRQLDIRNVYTWYGDGTLGLVDKAPFDFILVTASPEKTPDFLKQQLVDGGRMVIPTGCGLNQQLVLIKRDGKEFKQEIIEAVRFVPLISGSLS